MSVRSPLPLVSTALILGMLFGSFPLLAQRGRRSGDRTRAAPSALWGGLTVLEEGDSSANAALVLLHGYGGSENDLASFGAALTRFVPMRVVLPAGPRTSRFGGRSWFEQRAPDAAAQVADARARVEAVVATLAQRGVPSERVVVGGFSQGAILAIDVGLSRRQRLAGLAILAGRALSHPPQSYRVLRGLPIFQAHGRWDSAIPFARSELFRRRAVEAGALVEHVPFDGGHSIPREVGVALGRWLARVLAP